jgi:hypothetical protein
MQDFYLSQIEIEQELRYVAHLYIFYVDKLWMSRYEVSQLNTTYHPHAASLIPPSINF